MGISREVWDLRDSTPPNKEKTFPNKKKTPPNKKTAFQARKIPSKTRKTPFEQGNVFQASRGYLPLKYRSLQVVGVFRQGKAVVSDGGYGVIGG